MKITRELIMSHKPCSSPKRIDDFLSCFPEGIVTLEAVEKAKGYNLDWVAKRLLSSNRWAVYESKTAPLWAEYEAKRASLWADYLAKTAPLWADYEAERAPLWADYEAKRAPIFYEAFKEE